jgi:endonuclease YncB( thermonuclease family)
LLKKSTVALQALVLAALISTPTFAKTTKSEAPPPPAVPVPKVDAEALDPPGPEKVEGTAQVVDGDEIRVGDSVLRLYGIAAPDLSGRLGPEARVALDGLVNGQRVNCQVFGKTPQGDAFGQCQAGDADPAESLLSRGLAAVYRSGNNNDSIQQALSSKYDAAEAAARKQQLGLWQPPAPAANPQAAADERSKARILGYAGFALLILAIFTVSITRLSIARRDRAERDRLRREQRTTLSYAMAAEVEIVLAPTRRLIEQIANMPADRPVPGAIGAALALPSTTFWNANAERLYLLPVEVTIPLLRFHALHEDAVRKLAVASAVPSGTLAATLNGLIEIGAATVNAIEASLGIPKPPEPKAKLAAPPPPPAANPAAASSELKTPPRTATN